MTQNRKSQALGICSLLLSIIPILGFLVVYFCVVFGNMAEETQMALFMIAVLIALLAAPICGLGGILCGSLGLKQGQNRTLCITGIVLSFLIFLAGGFLARSMV